VHGEGRGDLASGFWPFRLSPSRFPDPHWTWYAPERAIIPEAFGKTAQACAVGIFPLSHRLPAGYALGVDQHPPFDLGPCLAGDARAWQAFVVRFAPVILAAVNRGMAGRSAEGVTVDDVVQDVFVRLVQDDFRSLRAFDPTRAALTTWLTVIAFRLAIDACRRRRLPIQGIAEWRELPAPEAAVSARDAPALDILPPRQQLVLRLLFDRGLSVEEAAAVLAIEPQTVRSLKSKAINRLRQHLSDAGAPR
jgi:RNA polymerase sigma factor (sigma-70 family)